MTPTFERYCSEPDEYGDLTCALEEGHAGRCLWALEDADHDAACRDAAERDDSAGCICRPAHPQEKQESR